MEHLARERQQSRLPVGAPLAVVFVVALAVYGPHVVRGGFAADDWVDSATYLFHKGTGFSAAVAAHSDPTRVLWAVISALDWQLMGNNTTLHLAQTFVASVAEAGLVLAVARRLGFTTLNATAMALFVLLWPEADSSRLWAAGAQQAIAPALLLAGLLVALIALARQGPRSMVLHAVATALYVSSVLVYELTAPLALVAGVVYVRRAGWSRARWPWAFDVACVGVTLLHRDLVSTIRPIGFTAALRHAGVIGDQALTLLARTIVPYGGIGRSWVLAGLCLMVAASAVVARLGPPDRRVTMRRSLFRLAVGVGVVIAGYAMLVPANGGYQPDSHGVSNRINAAAALGFALVVFALSVVAGDLVAVATRGSSRRAAGLAMAIFLAVIGAGTVRVLHDAGRWERASVEQQQTLAALRQVLPTPSPGTTVFTFGRSGYTAPSVLIFGGGGNNDLLGAVRVMWHDRSIRGFPVLDQMHFVCNADSVQLLGTGLDSTTTYGHAVFVDVRTLEVVVPADEGSCLVDSTRFPYASVNESNE